MKFRFRKGFQYRGHSQLFAIEEDGRWLSVGNSDAIFQTNSLSEIVRWLRQHSGAEFNAEVYGGGRLLFEKLPGETRPYADPENRARELDDFEI